MSGKGALRAAASAIGLVLVLTACGGGAEQADDGGGTLKIADGNSQLDTLLPADTQLAFSQLGLLWAASWLAARQRLPLRGAAGILG